jgi:5-methylcytosine-specific restriction endonuclease McrA
MASWDDTNVKPYPKSRQLARGDRRYRRKVASPKQWQAIIAAKAGPCRSCGDSAGRGGPIQYHHLVTRGDHGGDVADNIVPLCATCHLFVTSRYAPYCEAMLWTLSDAEYAYMIQRGGEDYPERAYGIRYTR